LFRLKEYLSILARPQAVDSGRHTWTSLYSDSMVTTGSDVDVVVSARLVVWMLSLFALVLESVLSSTAGSLIIKCERRRYYRMKTHAISDTQLIGLSSAIFYFTFASPRLWNQLPAFLRQPRTNPSDCNLGAYLFPRLAFPLLSTHHSRLKIFLLANRSHRSLSFFPRTDSMDSQDCYRYF